MFCLVPACSYNRGCTVFKNLHCSNFIALVGFMVACVVSAVNAMTLTCIACFSSFPDICLHWKEAVVVWILDWAWNPVLCWLGNGPAHLPTLSGEWNLAVNQSIFLHTVHCTLHNILFSTRINWWFSTRINWWPQLCQPSRCGHSWVTDLRNDVELNRSIMNWTALRSNHWIGVADFKHPCLFLDCFHFGPTWPLSEELCMNWNNNISYLGKFLW